MAARISFGSPVRIEPVDRLDALSRRSPATIAAWIYLRLAART
jgi:hypothetical protein